MNFSVGRIDLEDKYVWISCMEDKFTCFADAKKENVVSGAWIIAHEV